MRQPFVLAVQTALLLAVCAGSCGPADATAPSPLPSLPEGPNRPPLAHSDAHQVELEDLPGPLRPDAAALEYLGRLAPRIATEDEVSAQTSRYLSGLLRREGAPPPWRDWILDPALSGTPMAPRLLEAAFLSAQEDALLWAAEWAEDWSAPYPLRFESLRQLALLDPPLALHHLERILLRERPRARSPLPADVLPILSALAHPRTGGILLDVALFPGQDSLTRRRAVQALRDRKETGAAADLLALFYTEDGDHYLRREALLAVLHLAPKLGKTALRDDRSRRDPALEPFLEKLREQYGVGAP